MDGAGPVLTEPETSFSIFLPPPTHVMPEPTKEELRSGDVLSTFSPLSKEANIPMFVHVEKGCISLTLDIHLLSLVPFKLLYLMSSL